MEHYAEILALIGDFYESHANQDYPAMKDAINKLECTLEYPDVTSEPFLEYFSELYSGRGGLGALPGADYPAQSVIRELFQNAFDSYYSERDIKLAVNFNENNVISVAYNELSFTLEQLLYFLGVGRNDRDRMREGRFGIGAKSVFMNTESFSMRSSTFSLDIVNRNGRPEIESLDLKRPRFKGTEIKITVSESRYEDIFANFTSLCEARGKYINIVDLCFAFNRKKLLNSYVDRVECNERTFNIAVTRKGEFVTVYQVMKHNNQALNLNTIRFLHNGNSVVDFVCHEYNDVIFLVPFAVSGSCRRQVITLLSDRYNFFSTYELTGLLKTKNESFLNKKLSAFFISVPNTYVASSRTGIKHESEAEVFEKVKSGISDLIKKNKKYFLLGVREIEGEISSDGSSLCLLRPESYIFEFVKRFIFSSNICENSENEFLSSVSINFPGEKEPVPYPVMLETAYVNETKGVTKQEHDDGSAYEKYIVDALERCERILNDEQVETKTICVKYSWTGDEGERGAEFLYKFYRPEKCFVLSSKSQNVKSDFNLSGSFKNIAEIMAQEIVPDGELYDEDALLELFELLDTEYPGDYSVDIRECAPNVSAEDIPPKEESNTLSFIAETSDKIFNFSLCEMKIANLKMAMNVLESHKGTFESLPAYERFSNFIIDKFIGDSEPSNALKLMKEQGVDLEISLGRPMSFTAYGRQFAEKRPLTMAELLLLCEDKKALFNGGWLVGRKCDVTLESLNVSFEPEIIADLLRHSLLEEREIVRRVTSVYACDLDLKIIAFLDDSDIILGFNRFESDIDSKIKAARYCLLSTQCDKKTTSDIVERIVCGQSKGIVGHYFLRAPVVNRMLADQLPRGFKPCRALSKDEFNELKGFVKELNPFKDKPQYRNYFIKDLNYKFYGYGGVCSGCGYESGVLNAFKLCDFSLMCEDEVDASKEKRFNFSLLLCANDAVGSESWQIESLSIGNAALSPFNWLEAVNNADEIPAQMLSATLEYREQIAYGLPGVFRENTPETILNTPKRSRKIRLTPLMAAKWVEEN
ncbi:MAG: hypothetical protein FWH05_04050 [Oscillospiraceae bacterium]|nr:hypothetical protein [Oscillospiraceae bacterium]